MGKISRYYSYSSNSYRVTRQSKIIDGQIIKLENIETFENIHAYPIKIWELNYKLKAKTKNVEFLMELKKSTVRLLTNSVLLNHI